MNRITADFYIKINNKDKVIETIGRTTIYTPEIKFSTNTSSGIKWYEDTLKPEYRKLRA